MHEEGNLPTFQFEKLLNDEQELYKWLVTVATQTGLARIQNAPKEPGQVLKLGERVGYLAQTSFGFVCLQLKCCLSPLPQLSGDRPFFSILLLEVGKTLSGKGKSILGLENAIFSRLCIHERYFTSKH